MYALHVSGLDVDERARYDRALLNPQGAQTIAALQELGVA